LPREHASALCKVYIDNKSHIAKVLENESLKIGRLNDIDIIEGNQSEYIMKLNYAETLGKKNQQNNQFSITREQILLLIAGM